MCISTDSAFVSLPARRLVYPNDRTVSGSFDALYRKAGKTEGATGASIAACQYFGHGRVAEVALGNGIIQTMLNNARTHSAVQGTVPNPAWGTPSSDRLGYDGAGRFIGKRYLPGGINGTTFAYNNTNPVVGNTAGYDPASNKNFERALHAENTSNLYQPFDMTGEPGGGYDSINRLLQYQRGTLSATGGYLGDGGGSISTPIGINNTNVSRNWNLDGLGNWRSVQTLPANSCSAIADTRSHNKLNEITQRTTYQLPVPFAYDGAPGASNGNLINDGTQIYKFDALNRLVQVSRVSDGMVIATYVYDAMNRRVRKTITNGGLTGNIPDSTTDYFYSGWQCVEERTGGTTTPLRQYVWGNYIDECIQLTTFAALGAQNLPAGTYYLLQDLLYRAVALTNSTGAIVEAYDTDAYGNTIIFTAPDSSGNWWSNNATQSAFGANEIIFCGYRFDPETVLYYVRNRTYNPALGRWLQRDPLGYVDGDNLYEYCGGRAVVAADAEGRSTVSADIEAFTGLFVQNYKNGAPSRSAVWGANVSVGISISARTRNGRVFSGLLSWTMHANAKGFAHDAAVVRRLTNPKPSPLWKKAGAPVKSARPFGPYSTRRDCIECYFYRSDVLARVSNPGDAFLYKGINSAIDVGAGALGDAAADGTGGVSKLVLPWVASFMHLHAPANLYRIGLAGVICADGMKFVGAYGFPTGRGSYRHGPSLHDGDPYHNPDRHAWSQRMWRGATWIHAFGGSVRTGRLSSPSWSASQ